MKRLILLLILFVNLQIEMKSILPKRLEILNRKVP